MNSRERILAAINHKESDRIPIDLGATPSTGISVVAYANLLKYLGLDLESRTYDVVQQVVQPDEKILDRFGVDVVDIARYFNDYDEYWHERELIANYKALYPKWFDPRKSEDGSWLAYDNAERVIGRMPQGATFFDQTIYPYLDGYPQDLSNLSQDMKPIIWSIGISPWDCNKGPEFWMQLRERALEARANSDRALVIGVGCNLFECGGTCRRLDNFLMDMFISPNDVHRLLDAFVENYLETLKKVCESVGDVVDIIKFGDDLGMNSGPFIAHETYKEFFKPRHKMMCDYVKTHSKMTTMIHSCGSIESLMPDMIEAGFEIFNPVQISALNMEPEHLKREFGRDVVFWGGGCDTQGILNKGTVQQVRDHVRRNIEIFSKDGGFVFNPVHNIMPDVPPENVIAMFDTVLEYRY